MFSDPVPFCNVKPHISVWFIPAPQASVVHTEPGPWSDDRLRDVGGVAGDRCFMEV